MSIHLLCLKFYTVMNIKYVKLTVFYCAAIIATSCNSGTQKTAATAATPPAPLNSNVIEEHPVTYNSNGVELKGYVTYNAAQVGKRPVVLVVPEWWGLTSYPRMRAKKLAELGYLAMAVDMYGNGIVASDPQQAQQLAGEMYKNPTQAVARLNAALQKARSFPEADTVQTAAIGYCFGGTMVLAAAALEPNFKGVVSFHGGFEGIPKPKGQVETKILVCHGAADQFATPQQINDFKAMMQAAHADVTFKVYDSATHAFTNPEATALGKKFKMPVQYNAAADSASWQDMKVFLERLFTKP